MHKYITSSLIIVVLSLSLSHVLLQKQVEQQAKDIQARQKSQDAINVQLISNDTQATKAILNDLGLIGRSMSIMSKMSDRIEVLERFQSGQRIHPPQDNMPFFHSIPTNYITTNSIRIHPMLKEAK